MADNSSEGKVVGDVVKWMANEQFCVAQHTTKAATVDELYIGSMLKDDTGDIIVTTGGGATPESICLERKSVTGGESIKVLIRGPAIVNSDQFTLDGTLTAAQCKAALLALGILYYENTATFITQTT